jgi:RNA polymerase sigma-70 factor, ECF subfamily
LDELNEADLAERATQQDSVNQSDILRSLAALPQEYRSVLLLVGVEDLSYAQAAKVLDVPIGTVMSRLSRGRARLAQIMANGSATQVRTPLLRRIK